MLRYLTAGESHGPGLVALIEGLPAGFAIDVEAINADLRRRQGGHGRGNRQKIERDQVKVLSGLRFGYTLGSPLTFLIENRDYWPTVMSATPIEEPVAKAVTRPRPGHADLAGVLKYDLPDGRGVLERASARETAARVAVGSAAKQVLASLGILVFGHVVQIGPVKAEGWQGDAATPPFAFRRQAEASPVRCADPQASAAMVAEIDQAYRERDSLGGVAEVVALGLPPGLGSHVQADRRLDGRLAAALMSIQAVKGVEVGLGFAAAGLRGSAHHDEIGYAQGYIRYSNRAGGLEGGMTNGQPLVVRAALKPISTLYKPLRTVQLDTHEPALATVERADTCAVPAFAVIAEAVVALTLATALLEKIGGDSLGECRRNLQGYWQQLARR